MAIGSAGVYLRVPRGSCNRSINAPQSNSPAPPEGAKTGCYDTRAYRFRACRLDSLKPRPGAMMHGRTPPSVTITPSLGITNSELAMLAEPRELLVAPRSGKPPSAFLKCSRLYSIGAHH
jgi:hypothetical protein